MRDKNILITGATSGIGKGITQYFLSLGAKIVAVGRNVHALDELVEEYPEQLFCYQYDLNDITHVEDILIFSKEKGLVLDGFLHCAGMVENMPIKSTDVEAMSRMMNINCFSFVEIGKYFSLKKYSNNQSSIVAISSIESILKSKGLAHYSASKVALNSFIKTMSKEFSKRKIRVNGIAPAAVDTPMIKQTALEVEGYEEHILQIQKLGMIDIIQLGYLAEFLMSDKAKYITGEVIVVSGGMEY